MMLCEVNFLRQIKVGNKSHNVYIFITNLLCRFTTGAAFLSDKLHV